MAQDYKYQDRIVQVGLNIAFFRKRAGLTQLELAERANLSRTFLSQVEAPGVNVTVSLEKLFAISDALGIEPNQLLVFRD